MSIRVVLADDHQMIREGIRSLVANESEIEVVGEAGDGLSALEQARTQLPDVVVMDIGMPGGSGISVTRQIRSELSDVRVVGLSVHSDHSFVEAMLDAGASAYVVKKSAFRSLITAIQCAAAGELYLSPEIDGLEIREYANGGKARRNGH